MAGPNRILLIEDEPGDVELVRVYLADGASLGLGEYELTAVHRVSEAVHALGREAFDVVLLDLNVLDSAGIASLHRVQEAAPMMPVVILTGLNDSTTGEQAIAAGAQDYLPKALLDADRLSRALRYAMRRARMSQRLRSVVENNADAMVVVGTDDGLIKFANRAATYLFGQSVDELLGTAFPYETGEASVTEIEVTAGDLSRAAEMRISLLDWDGAPAYLASLRDVTDRRRAEDLKRRLIHSDRLAAIGQLAAGVAHEVNNPAQYILENLRQSQEALNTAAALLFAYRHRILGGEDGDTAIPCEQVITDHDLDQRLAELRSMNEANQRGMERIVDIVRDLRGFARSERENLERVDVNDAVKVACNMTHTQIRHRAQLHTRLAELPPIAGDRGKLCQVLTNLMLNAAQAIEEGAAERNHISVSTALIGDHIRVSVEDTGAGIPDDIRPQIFEPFFTTKPREVGTGLGLPLTADIVRQHGGEIQVESTAGRGTRFDVLLPLRSSLALPRKAPSVEPCSPHQRARVLIIDDEIQLLLAFERMLRREHDVVAAEGGESALELLNRDDDFDVIICDLMMPQVDGKQVYQHLSRHQPHLARRMVFCSGGAFTDRMREFLTDAGNAYLEKPVDRIEVMKIIGRVTARTAAEALPARAGE